MPKHTHAEHYLSKPSELTGLPIVTLHPEVQRSPSPGAEHYLLPAVFTLNQGEYTAKYPGNGVYYIFEGEMEYEDTKNPGHIVKIGAGSVVHIEEQDTLRWYSPSQAKGFAVFWVPVSIKGFESFIHTE